MLTSNDPIGSTLVRVPFARFMQLRAAEELVERAVRAAESASGLLKAARRERDEAKARVKKLEALAARAGAWKTTDGVWVYGLDRVFMPNSTENGWDADMISGPHRKYCYSTREAAERAKGGE